MKPATSNSNDNVPKGIDIVAELEFLGQSEDWAVVIALALEFCAELFVATMGCSCEFLLVKSVICSSGAQLSGDGTGAMLNHVTHTGSGNNVEFLPLGSQNAEGDLEPGWLLCGLQERSKSNDEGRWTSSSEVGAHTRFQEVWSAS